MGHHTGDDPGATVDERIQTYPSEVRQASNHGRRQLFGTTQRQIAFVCECTRPVCFETVRLTAEEYDTRRPDAILFPHPVETQVD